MVRFGQDMFEPDFLIFVAHQDKVLMSRLSNDFTIHEQKKGFGIKDS